MNIIVTELKMSSFFFIFASLYLKDGVNKFDTDIYVKSYILVPPEGEVYNPKHT